MPAAAVLRALPSRAPNEIDSDRGSLAALAAPAPLAIDFAAPLATPVLRDAQGCMGMQPKTKKERKPVMSEQKSLSQAELRQFTGTERWYRHGINHNVLYTDGAKYVADTAGAYWLLDAIAIIQPQNKHVGAEAFQVWRLSVHPDRSGVLTCEDGNGKEVFRQVIPYTEFPADGITLYFQNSTIFLLSEY
jgi:hypothetical protein